MAAVCQAGPVCALAPGSPGDRTKGLWLIRSCTGMPSSLEQTLGQLAPRLYLGIPQGIMETVRF